MPYIDLHVCILCGDGAAIPCRRSFVPREPLRCNARLGVLEMQLSSMALLYETEATSAIRCKNRPPTRFPNTKRTLNLDLCIFRATIHDQSRL